MAYDVLFDNLGTLSFPPQYSSTNNVDDPGQPAYSSPNFLKNGGLPPGTGSGITNFPNTPAGLAQQRAATSALLPDQVLPYAETYTLTVQRTIGSAYTAEIGYIGTRGIHLATQDQINIQPKVTAANQLGTVVNGSTQLIAPGRLQHQPWRISVLFSHRTGMATLLVSPARSPRTSLILSPTTTASWPI